MRLFRLLHRPRRHYLRILRAVVLLARGTRDCPLNLPHWHWAFFIPLEEGATLALHWQRLKESSAWGTSVSPKCIHRLSQQQGSKVILKQSITLSPHPQACTPEPVQAAMRG